MNKVRRYTIATIISAVAMSLVFVVHTRDSAKKDIENACSLVKTGMSSTELEIVANKHNVQFWVYKEEARLSKGAFMETYSCKASIENGAVSKVGSVLRVSHD